MQVTWLVFNEVSSDISRHFEQDSPLTGNRKRRTTRTITCPSVICPGLVGGGGVIPVPGRGRYPSPRWWYPSPQGLSWSGGGHPSPVPGGYPSPVLAVGYPSPDLTRGIHQSCPGGTPGLAGGTPILSWLGLEYPP